MGGRSALSREAALSGAWLALCLATGAQEGSAQQLLAEIEAFDSQVALLGGQLETLEGTVTAARADADAKLAAAEAAEAEVTGGSDSVRALVRALYRIRRFGALRLLLGADDPVELRRRVYYLRAVIVANQARTVDYVALAEQGRAAAAASASANEASLRLREQLLAQREALEEERKRRVALLREIQKRPAMASQYRAEVADARASFTQSVATREATLPSTVGGSDTASFRSLRGRLRKPVAGRLLRGFGPYADPASGARSTNLGIDWAAGAGTSFAAVADGVVTRAGYVRGYGQMVMLQHGAYTTLYAHASSLRVAVEQRVREGETLGIVGATGLADGGGERLHFELRYNGTPQDPAEWLAP
ncbi:MAG: M23 family metallopeptidase [Deltaproteobacteria bacterium]|nr:M23 family metallopeptidase [Deltaproteobacteria bacterium]